MRNVTVRDRADSEVHAVYQLNRNQSVSKWEAIFPLPGCVSTCDTLTVLIHEFMQRTYLEQRTFPAISNAENVESLEACAELFTSAGFHVSEDNDSYGEV